MISDYFIYFSSFYFKSTVNQSLDDRLKFNQHLTLITVFHFYMILIIYFSSFYFKSTVNQSLDDRLKFNQHLTLITVFHFYMILIDKGDD